MQPHLRITIRPAPGSPSYSFSNSSKMTRFRAQLENGPVVFFMAHFGLLNLKIKTAALQHFLKINMAALLCNVRYTIYLVGLFHPPSVLTSQRRWNFGIYQKVNLFYQRNLCSNWKSIDRQAQQN